ncbi:TetR/AcrR family transcriptional regulator [Nocardioides alkalitolerans]|uniref:TetR/AcrR family transcriptional regulator n=1 Tax=Nocardioides alkalitolerans TaxID=281714 RepID=UPI0003FDA7B4|nr:TetR/AcrR family transcriptional regulator [Nocardioides alkalitolerans]
MPAPRRRRPRRHDGTSQAEHAVFDATEKLMVSKTFADITVADILTQAGMSRANFYHYFASKYDVLAALLLRLGNEAAELARTRIVSPDRISTQLVETVMTQSLELWRAHGTVLCAASEWAHEIEEIGAAWADMRRRFVEPMTEHLRRDRAAAGLPDHGDDATVATLLACGIERTLYVTLRGIEPRLPSSEDAFATIRRLAEVASDTDFHAHLPARPAAEPAPPAVRRDPSAAAAAATDQVILDALAELLLDLPIQDVSVARILEQARVSRATFYFYFASKDDAFLALYQQMSERLVGDFVTVADPAAGRPASSTDLVRPWLTLDAAALAVFRNAVHEWTRHPVLRDAYLEHARTMTQTIEDALRAGRESGVVPEGPAAEQVAATILWTVERGIAGALVGEEHLEDLTRVADVVGSLVGAAVLQDPPGH